MTGSKGIEHRGRGGRWRLAPWGAAALLLALPFVAMQVTDEVTWSVGDFAIFAAMLVAACGAFELVMRTIVRPVPRMALGLMIAAAFVLVWAQLAVGIFGS